jgi:hypothetical protein
VCDHETAEPEKQQKQYQQQQQQQQQQNICFQYTGVSGNVHKNIKV